MGVMISRTTMISFLILISLILISIIPSNAISESTQLDDLVVIHINETEQTAAPNPNAEGTVEFTGRVSAETPQQGRTIVVDLSTSDPWDTSTITPTEVQFSVDNTVDKLFTVTVSVPAGESSSKIGTLRVTGKWQITPGTLSGDCTPASASVYVRQYFYFTVDSPKPVLDSLPGTQEEFKLDITNEGNGPDNFLVEIQNIDQLTDNGFNINIEQQRIEILENEKQTVNIRVRSPSSSEGVGEHLILVAVTSENGEAEGLGPDFISLTLKVESAGILLVPEVYIPLIIIIAVVIVAVFWIRKKRKKKKQELDE